MYKEKGELWNMAKWALFRDGVLTVFSDLMSKPIDALIGQFLPSKISGKSEKRLKNTALMLGLLSGVAIVMDWYPLTMFLSLPFCLMWLYFGWLRREPQLKWINLTFVLIYLYGIFHYIHMR